MLAYSLTTWTALTAVGTIAVAIIALFTDRYHVWMDKRRRPELTVTLRDGDSAVETTQWVPTMSSLVIMGEAAFVRVAVSNRTGRHAAEDVEVLLEWVEPTDGEVIRIGSPALGWTHLGGVPLTIAPGVTRLVDLATVERPGSTRPSPPENEEQKSLLVLNTVPQPANLRNRLPEGTYRLRLVVSAHNADARFYELVIEFDGEWGDEQESVWDHLTVTTPPTLMSA